jgi:hypothetical protein
MAYRIRAQPLLTLEDAGRLGAFSDAPEVTRTEYEFGLVLVVPTAAQRNVGDGRTAHPCIGLHVVKLEECALSTP